MPIVGEETFAPILYVMSYRIARRGDRDPELGRAGTDVGDLHERPARSRAIPLGRGIGLRDRQRQYRHLGRRDRRRLRRREGHRRRSRSRLGRLESLHAPADLHDQLRARTAAGSRCTVRRLSRHCADRPQFRLGRRTRSPDEARDPRGFNRSEPSPLAQAAPLTAKISGCHSRKRSIAARSSDPASATSRPEF